MTTIYVPRLIESVEQAEALPVGTVSIDLDSQGQPRQASIRVRCGWYCTGEVTADGSPWLAPYDAMAGDYALVPVEAEEEWKPDMDAIPPWPEPTPDPFPGKTRYVTPWTKEEA